VRAHTVSRAGSTLAGEGIEGPIGIDRHLKGSIVADKYGHLGTLGSIGYCGGSGVEKLLGGATHTALIGTILTVYGSITFVLS
jgi:hypothetical protein